MDITNKRLEGETFKKYRERLKEDKRIVRAYLKGRQIWNSFNKGTYIRKLHGKIGIES